MTEGSRGSLVRGVGISFYKLNNRLVLEVLLFYCFYSKKPLFFSVVFMLKRKSGNLFPLLPL